MRMLTRRFGALHESAHGRVQSASKTDLEATADRLLTASSLAEALGSD